MPGSVKTVPLRGGPVRVLDANAYGPTEVTTDGVRVYWSEGLGRIATVPIGGGTTTAAVLGSGPMPLIAVDATAVYVGDGAIKRFPLNGQPPEIISRSALPHYLATDGSYVYWTGSSLNKMPTTGGAITALGSGSGALSLHEGYAYWATWQWGGINRVATAGGPVSVISPLVAFDLVADDTNVYFSNGGLIRRVPVAGGPPVQLVGLNTSWGSYWTYLAADFNNLYWIDYVGVGKVAKDGSASVELYTPLDSDYDIGNGIAADGAHVYWSEINGGTIKMMYNP
jgi:hypothetical protein